MLGPRPSLAAYSHSRRICSAVCRELRLGNIRNTFSGNGTFCTGIPCCEPVGTVSPRPPLTEEGSMQSLDETRPGCDSACTAQPHCAPPRTQVDFYNFCSRIRRKSRHSRSTRSRASGSEKPCTCTFSWRDATPRGHQWQPQMLRASACAWGLRRWLQRAGECVNFAGPQFYFRYFARRHEPDRHPNASCALRPQTLAALFVGSSASVRVAAVVG